MPDLNSLYSNTDELPIFIAQPQKTGDMTVKNTLKENNIKNYFTNHNTNFLTNKLLRNNNKKIRIITSVRDPIAQNISKLYHIIFQSRHYLDPFNFIKDFENFFKNGGDSQTLLDHICNQTSYANHKNFNISTFFELFKKDIIDLSKHPFDKEKGYTIVKEGNIEVFVYQLEKMNDIVNEMSNWVGETQFSEWVVSNETSNTWVANSYKQAQKEIKFSRDYVNKSYDSMWVKHFYSDGDIEKFKAKWESHIK